MEISMWMFWNIILTLVIAPAVWAFRGLIQEVKRIDILLNKTREEYVTRKEMRDDLTKVMDALHRVEDKLDKLKDGDFLIYADAGCVINNEGKERLLEYFDMLNKSEYGIISFQMDHKELNWTTGEVFKYFDVDLKSTIANSGQIMATLLIMQKKPHLLKIIEEAYKVLDYDDKLFTNEYGYVDNKKTQHAGFKDTRHDQSIMSMIRKIHGSIVLKDETLSHLPESKNWPIWAKRLK